MPAIRIEFADRRHAFLDEFGNLLAVRRALLGREEAIPLPGAHLGAEISWNVQS